uniref:Uncharacterized protein n=1 Tax=Siphoviridae sp. ct3Ka2 TaxID=2826281 RepID=A0A8S5MZY9_9CAUD|nr:MAG TPA: hypothetical protein [Siphoviridae sp. ct3Ka2]
MTESKHGSGLPHAHAACIADGCELSVRSRNSHYCAKRIMTQRNREWRRAAW